MAQTKSVTAEISMNNRSFGQRFPCLSKKIKSVSESGDIIALDGTIGCLMVTLQMLQTASHNLTL
jgi:hypothetical protein